ncbi:PIN domain-containing protein [Streptomyces chilikensis]|uniref:PIN domain-containing protein n=1 Tax=Streptomyces chilikensis TaxID=1194079 RepID=A0ABV3ERF3_9ACTN
MLISPRPGTNRDNLLTTLRSVHTAAMNAHSSGPAGAYPRLLHYLEWAADSVRVLTNQVSPTDLTSLILTPRHDALLASASHLSGPPSFDNHPSLQKSPLLHRLRPERLVNALVSQELTDRIQALEAAIDALTEQINRWSGEERFVVADSSFYCHNPVKLADVDLHRILDLRPHEEIRLLFPIAVVDELDGLKESGKAQSRWRAHHTLGLLDQVLAGATSAVWQPGSFRPEVPEIRGTVSFEIVLDPAGHTRLPITDDEIISRAVAIRALAGREVRLLTCDTGQHTRGRAADLPVTKVPTEDPGPEPEWTKQGTPSNGTRARRKAQKAAAAAEEATPPAP